MNVHITLLGQETLPLFYLVKKFPQDVVYVLTTHQNQEIAKQVSAVLSESVDCKLVEVDPYDIKSTIDICESIHSEYADANFLYNLTGGTKIMAIASYVVAKKHSADIIYTDSKKCIDLQSFNETPLDCKVPTETLIRLQGQKLRSYTVYKSDDQLVSLALKIKLFVDKHRKFYTVLGNCYRKNKQIPGNTLEKSGYVFQKNGNKISITYKESVIFESDNEAVSKLLFDGRWWEVIVADDIYRWSNGRFEVWFDVQFELNAQPNGKKINKNEVDVLLNVGNTLVFVECKSGDVTQENIYTMKFVRETYGSAKAKSLLITYFPIFDDKAEKLKDAQIDYVCPTRGNLTISKSISKSLDKVLKSLKL